MRRRRILNRTRPWIQRRDILIRPAVLADTSHRIITDWLGDPARRDLRHEVVPPVAHLEVARVRGVYAVAQVVHVELREVDSHDVLPGREARLHDAGDEGLVLDGLRALRGPRSGDDHGDEDGGVRALGKHLVDEVPEASGGGSGVGALGGDAGVRVYVVGASVKEDDVGSLSEGVVDVVGNILDRLAGPCCLTLLC